MTPKVNAEHFTLTLSCQDAYGIVAEVSGFLAKNHCFIIESAQFGDPTTNQFFMRTVFASEHDKTQTTQNFEENFAPIAEQFNMQWQLSHNNSKPNIVIMVSKLSHCLNDLLHRHANGALKANISGVISNHPDLESLVKWYEIPFFHFPVTSDNKEEIEPQIWQLLEGELNADLVVLARYMQILTPYLVEKLPGRIINIHHSFLPSFKGARPYHQAHERGVKLIGATAHYVNNDLDEGPIIDQEVTRVNHAHGPKQLLSMGQDIECQVLSRAVHYHLERRVLINGNKTVVFR